jgi:hypothetical protein
VFLSYTNIVDHCCDAWNNRVFDSYEATVGACCATWNALTALPERIRSITQRSWAIAVNL